MLNEFKEKAFLFFGNCCEEHREFPVTCVYFRTNLDIFRHRDVLTGPNELWGRNDKS